MKMSVKEPFLQPTFQWLKKKKTNMNAMHGVDNFTITIQAAFSQCSCVFRTPLKACDVIVAVTLGNFG